MTSRFPSPDAPMSPSVVDTGIAFAPTITPDTYQDGASSIDYPFLEPEMLSVDFQDLDARRPTNSRRKSPNHIPRPPNAFILFRSAFIKSERVTSGVETSHSTLSKIIGLTWQQLSNEERQKWHMKAKIEQEEHKRRYPQYSFRPIHKRLKGPQAERRRLREIGPKDEKRCEKIAELLACGKKGRELEEEIKEFDKHHVPRIVTRFEEPITASSFSASTTSCRGPSPSSSSRTRRSVTPSSQGRPGTSRSAAMPTPPPVFQVDRESQLPTTTEPLSFDTNTFFPSPSHSFDIDNFAFSIREPSPTICHGGGLTPVVNGSFDIANGSSRRNSALLCQRYSHVEDWAPPCSPISTNSTGSLPTTPAPISVPLSTEQPIYLEQNSYHHHPPPPPPPHSTSPLSVSADSIHVQKYAQQAHHQDFVPYSQYGQTYGSHDHLSMPQSDSTTTKRAGGVPPCFLVNVNMEGNRGVHTPIAGDLDLFFESFPPYPL